jgi:DNA-binding beta-propeller fold protein YncE
MLRLLKTLFAASLALIAAWIIISACDDKPTKPVPLVDYPVYFSNPELTPKLFIYHPVTRQVDSTIIPWRAREGVTVSADGKRLYLGQRTSVVVVDTDSLSLIAELPYEPDRPVAVSPDNKYIAITGDDLYILRTTDYSMVFSDTDVTQNGYFSYDSKSFYCAAGWSPGNLAHVYKVDLSDSLFPVTRRLFADGGVTYIVPSIDESKWFLYLHFATFGSVFEVYDVLRDSIIFRETLVPGYGRIAITPDGKYVFYTNACRDGATILPSELAFTIFDVEANRVERVVADDDFFSGNTWFAPPYDLAVTPDGRWLAMMGGCSIGLGVLYLYDIPKGQLVHREDFGGNRFVFTNVSAQNAR